MDDEHYLMEAGGRMGNLGGSGWGHVQPGEVAGGKVAQVSILGISISAKRYSAKFWSFLTDKISCKNTNVCSYKTLYTQQ
jgi:hypothetical protein